jgi:hypothetical protein
MATNPLPRTPGSAPPNFYTQVGQQGGAPGGPGQAGAAGGGQQGQQPPPQQQAPGQNPDQDFIDISEKMLTALAKMGMMQPKGQNIAKYTQAMAQTLKDCMKNVFGQGGGKGTAKGTPGSTSSAADQGVGGNDAAAGNTTGTTGVGSASNATGIA